MLSGTAEEHKLDNVGIVPGTPWDPSLSPLSPCLQKTFARQGQSIRVWLMTTSITYRMRAAFRYILIFNSCNCINRGYY